jgi:hypothetical protein
MLTNSVECEYLLKVALEKMSESGVNSIAKDLKDEADKVHLFIARERCEFINRCVLANVAITMTTTTTLYDVTKLGNDSEQNQKLKKQRTQQQKTTTVLSKPAMTRTKKCVASMSKPLTKSPDSEEENDTKLSQKLMTTNTQSTSKSMAKNTQSTPKLNRLRPRTVGADAKELANNSHKSSINSSSNGKKRKKDETDDNNLNEIPKKKKPRVAIKQH